MAENETKTPLSLCRVCLVSDRATFQVVDTSLEHTYYRITTDMLNRIDRPATLCCICLSQLRRCRRFMETAQEANSALDQWYRSQSECKLIERPLLSLVNYREMFEYVPDGSHNEQVTQEKVRRCKNETKAGLKDSINDDTTIKPEEIKHEISIDPNQFLYDENDYHTEFDVKNSKTDQVFLVLPNFETVNVLDEEMSSESDVRSDRKLLPEDVSDESKATAGTSGTVKRLRRRAKLNQDVNNAPAPKKRKPKKIKEQTHKCTVCEYTTTDEKEFKRHKKTHRPKKMYMCDQCGYSNENPAKLRQHLLIHTDLKPFACNQCDFKCNSKSSLGQHIFRKHSNEKPFACDQCTYRCSHKNNLTKHLRKHTGEKPFSCEQCDYKCSFKGSLSYHISAHHSIDRPYKCDKCEYKCISKGNLQIHQYKHTEEKPFTCDKCGFRCSYKGRLRAHQLTHSEEKLYSCEKCDYKSNFKVNIKEHNSTRHSDLKMFSCDQCGYSCKLEKSLKRHSLIHTDQASSYTEPVGHASPLSYQDGSCSL